MELFTNEIIRDLLAHSLETATVDASGWHDVGEGPGSRAGDSIDWLTVSDREGAVIDDVRRVRTHPLVPKTIPIYGYIYDVKTGTLIEVPEAMAAGKAG